MHSLNDPKHKISRQFKALEHFRENGWAYPISTEIDLTWRCSLNCKGCHSKWMHTGRRDGVGEYELQPEDIRKILIDLTDHGLKSVQWAGGGDPLESPHWRYAFNLAADMGLEQGLYSYLPGLDQEMVNFLHRRMRFVYTHSCAPKGLYMQYGDDAPVPCTWTYGWLLDCGNWHRMRGMISQTNLNFFDYVDFRPLAPENDNGPEKEMDFSWVMDAMEVLSELSKHNPQIKFAEYKFRDLIAGTAHPKDAYPACYSTDFSAMIGPNGDMYQCVNRRNITVIGNILKEGLEAVWAKKIHAWTDFQGCRMLCCKHEMNKTLSYLLGTRPQHEVFV